MDVVSTPIVEAGKITGAVVAFSDITERRRAGERVALLTLALNNVHEAAYLIGEDGGFLYVNEGACRALGYTSHELLQMHVPDIDPGMPAERWPDHWRELKAKSTLTFEGYHKAKDGQVFPIEINANHFESGGRSYNLALVRDITERKRAEEELRRYKDQLEETVQQRTSELLLARDAAETANKAKSVFLANISHELRTPLNAILGFSSLMRREPDVSPSQQERLDIINRSGEYLLTLINDVLEMAKIEAGRLQLESAPFDLGAMVRDVADMMRLRAEEKGLRLLLDQSSAFPRHIKGDEARLRQILINLTANAVKFTSHGGVTIRLGLRRDDRPHLLIEVEDSGVGIKPEDQKRLFQPFVQLGEPAAQKGTGLGLTITRQFVELMGGSIGVASTPGKGSIFRVELPGGTGGGGGHQVPARRYASRGGMRPGARTAGVPHPHRRGSAREPAAADEADGGHRPQRQAGGERQAMRGAVPGVAPAAYLDGPAHAGDGRHRSHPADPPAPWRQGREDRGRHRLRFRRAAAEAAGCRHGRLRAQALPHS